MPQEDIANSSNVVKQLAKSISYIINNFMMEYSSQVKNTFIQLALPFVTHIDTDQSSQKYDRFGLYRDEVTYFVPGLVYNKEYIDHVERELKSPSTNMFVSSFRYELVPTVAPPAQKTVSEIPAEKTVSEIPAEKTVSEIPAETARVNSDVSDKINTIVKNL